MTTYILLRDNKESTPLSLATLKDIGLKSSDLVWVEGQSVCWLNPGQIKELRELVSGNSQSVALPITEVLPIPEIIPDQPGITIPDPERDSIQPASAISEKQTEFEKTRQEVIAEKKQEPEQTVSEQKHVFVSLPQTERNQQPVFKNEVEKEYAKFLPSNHTAEKPIVTEEFPLAETKYSKPLSEIKQLYLENLEKRNSKKTFQIPPQVKKVGFYVILFITGLTAGLIIKNSFAKKQDLAQSQLRRTAVSETAELPLVSNEIPAYTEPIVNEPGRQDQLMPSVSPTTSKTKRAEDLKFPGINPETGTQEEQANPEIPVPSPGETDPAVTEKPVEEEKPVRKPSIKEIYSQVAVKNNDYTVGSFGGIKNLELTITNHSRYALDEVEVQVKYFKPMDEFLKSEMVSVRSIPPGGSKTIAVPKSSRGVKVSCKVRAIESKDFLNSTAGL